MPKTEKNREYHDRWKAKDPEHVRRLVNERQKAYRKRHPARVKASKRAVYERMTVEDIKRWTLRREFDMTLEEYNEILASQQGVCAICRKPETAKPNPRTTRPGTPKTRSLAVDHCHATNKIRGLLCTSCNNGLGRFKDNADLLEAAARYLRGAADGNL